MMDLSGALHDISHLPAGFESYFCSRRNTFRRRTASKITDSIVPAMGLTMLKTRSKNINSSSRTTLLLSSALEKKSGWFFRGNQKFQLKRQYKNFNKKIENFSDFPTCFVNFYIDFSMKFFDFLKNHPEKFWLGDKSKRVVR